MCGIFGYVTTKPVAKNTNILAQGLTVDTLRGTCGTGIYAYSLKEKEQDVFKRALPGPDFINTKQFDMFSAKAHSYNVVIGHNRAATQGAARDSNCHPFVFGDIGLVHNGTLRGYNRLVKEHKFTHQVDSAYAAKGMSENGEKETLDKTDGPFVFVWHNRALNTFNIARNNNRDIWWILDKEGDTLWYASEYLMLAWLLDRNGVEIGNRKFRGLNEHQWLSWDLEKGLKVPKSVQFEEYKPSYSYQQQGYSGLDSGWRSRDELALSKYGLEMYQPIEIKIESWEAYQSGNWGTIEGFAVGKEGDLYANMPVRVHSVPPELYAKFRESGKCIAKVNYLGNSWSGSKDLGAYLSCNSPEAFSEEKLEGKSKSTALTETFQGPPGVFRSKEDMLEAISGGCCYCGDPIGFNDLSKLVWIEWSQTDTYPICPKCATDKQAIGDLNSYGKLLRLNG